MRGPFSTPITPLPGSLFHADPHVINSDRTIPSVSAFQERFGKLTNAYRLAGLPHGRTELQRLGHARLKASRAGEPPRKIARPRWAELASRFSDDDLLECLRRLHKQHGYVTAQIIREDDYSPTPMVFAVRFGSLLKAYGCAGIENRRFDIWSRAGKARAAARRAEKLATEPQPPKPV